MDRLFVNAILTTIGLSLNERHNQREMAAGRMPAWWHRHPVIAYGLAWLAIPTVAIGGLFLLSSPPGLWLLNQPVLCLFLAFIVFVVVVNRREKKFHR